jgi:hypothetical protein
MKYMFSILIIFTVLFSGCAGTTYTKPIKKGKVEDREIVIKADDGSFELKGEFDSPFVSNVHYHSYNINGTKFIKGYRRALEFGAKHVRVKVPYMQEELYGVLALDNADERGIGEGIKSYKIVIPKPYVEAAKDGKISVVYEYYHLKNDELTDLSDVKKYSWILWLSDKDVFR